MLAQPNGLVPGLLHMRRRREIRLPDAEAGDVIALGDELVDFSEHDESVFCSEGLGAAGEF